MNDKEVINEFAKLYNDYSNLDKALVEIKKIISPRKYNKLIKGLSKVRK